MSQFRRIADRVVSRYDDYDPELFARVAGEPVETMVGDVVVTACIGGTDALVLSDWTAEAPDSDGLRDFIPLTDDVRAAALPALTEAAEAIAGRGQERHIRRALEDAAEDVSW